MESMRAAALPDVNQDLICVETFMPQTLDQLCTLLAVAHCVAVSRLHGVMLSQLLLRPVLAISLDRKMDLQMAQLRQDSFLTQIQTVTCEELHLLFANLLASRDKVQEQLRAWYEFSDRAVQSQFDATMRFV